MFDGEEEEEITSSQLPAFLYHFFMMSLLEILSLSLSQLIYTAAALPRALYFTQKSDDEIFFFFTLNKNAPT